jgi:hypothetical protein
VIVFLCLMGTPKGAGLDDRQRKEIFILSKSSRPALGDTEPPIQAVSGVLSPG